MKAQCIAMMSLLLVLSCKARNSDSKASDTQSSVDMTTGTFFAGLATRSGSGRLAAANALEAALAEPLQIMAEGIPTDEDPDGNEAKIMLTAIKNSIDYLRGKKLCDDSERITLYRGFGRQPLFGPNGDNGDGFMLNNIWMDAVIADAKDLKSSGAISFEDRSVEWASGMVTPQISGDYLGKVIFNIRDKITRFSLANEDWQNRFYGYNFGTLAKKHTNDESTILISASLVPKVTNRYGPGFMKLTVCPERALPVKATNFFNEMEVYIPFFILPEEIQSIEGFECGELKDQLSRTACFNREYTDAEENVTNNTKIYRQCMLNFEAGSYFETEEPLKHRYTEIVSQYYDLLPQSKTSGELMSDLKNICKPSCETHRKVEKALRERLGFTHLNAGVRKQLEESFVRSQAISMEQCASN